MSVQITGRFMFGKKKKHKVEEARERKKNEVNEFGFFMCAIFFVMNSTSIIYFLIVK